MLSLLSLCTPNIADSQEKAKQSLDPSLVAILDTIYRDDQNIRRQIIKNEYRHKIEAMKALLKTIREKDSLNVVKVKNILDERGWLGPDVIGEQRNKTLFLVIQHAELETQVKYLPMLKAAVKKGNAKAKSLALLEDRIAIAQGKPQIYGSQLKGNTIGEYYVSPIMDPEHVAKRRAAVGLGPLADYLRRWNITWNVETHKKQTAKMASENKN